MGNVPEGASLGLKLGRVGVPLPPRPPGGRVLASAPGITCGRGFCGAGFVGVAAGGSGGEAAGGLAGILAGILRLA